MQLTGKQIVDQGIVKGYCEIGVQQQGVDVRLTKLLRTSNARGSVKIGYVPAEGKTVLPERVEVPAYQNEWVLDPGYYEIEFKEACKIPANCVLNFKTRSSLVRCGALVHSGQFDGGFETDHMGAFLQVLSPIRIEKGARVAQAVVSESYTVDNEHLYNGQWQNDKQRV